MSKRQPKAVFYTDEKGEWRWRLVASNGKVLCTPGESFSSKTKAQKNYEKVEDAFNGFVTMVGLAE